MRVVDPEGQELIFSGVFCAGNHTAQPAHDRTNGAPTLLLNEFLAGQ